MPVAEVERWLAPNLAYEPEVTAAPMSQLGGDGVAEGIAVVKESAG